MGRAGRMGWFRRVNAAMVPLIEPDDGYWFDTFDEGSQRNSRDRTMAEAEKNVTMSRLEWIGWLDRTARLQWKIVKVW